MAVFITTYLRTKQLVSDHRELSGLFLDFSKQAGNALASPCKVCSLNSPFQGNLKKRKMAKDAMDLYLRALKESNKSRFDSYSVSRAVGRIRFCSGGCEHRKHEHLGGIRRYISPGNLKNQVVEVHFSRLLRVNLTLPLRLSGRLRPVRVCGRTYHPPPPPPPPTLPTALIRDSVLIMSQITSWDFPVCFYPNNLSRNSCILVAGKNWDSCLILMGIGSV